MQGRRPISARSRAARARLGKDCAQGLPAGGAFAIARWCLSDESALPLQSISAPGAIDRTQFSGREHHGGRKKAPSHRLLADASARHASANRRAPSPQTLVMHPSLGRCQPSATQPLPQRPLTARVRGPRPRHFAAVATDAEGASVSSAGPVPRRRRESAEHLWAEELMRFSPDQPPEPSCSSSAPIPSTNSAAGPPPRRGRCDAVGEELPHPPLAATAGPLPRTDIETARAVVAGMNALAAGTPLADVRALWRPHLARGGCGEAPGHQLTYADLALVTEAQYVHQERAGHAAADAGEVETDMASHEEVAGALARAAELETRYNQQLSADRHEKRVDAFARLVDLEIEQEKHEQATRDLSVAMNRSETRCEDISRALEVALRHHQQLTRAEDNSETVSARLAQMQAQLERNERAGELHYEHASALRALLQVHEQQVAEHSACMAAAQEEARVAAERASELEWQLKKHEEDAAAAALQQQMAVAASASADEKAAKALALIAALEAKHEKHEKDAAGVSAMLARTEAVCAANTLAVEAQQEKQERAMESAARATVVENALEKHRRLIEVRYLEAEQAAPCAEENSEAVSACLAQIQAQFDVAHKDEGGIHHHNVDLETEAQPALLILASSPPEVAASEASLASEANPAHVANQCVRGAISACLPLGSPACESSIALPAQAALPGALPPASPEADNVVVSLKMENMDYFALIGNAELMDAFTMTVKETIAHEAGDGILPEHVQVQLSAGSVVVTATVHPPDAIHQVKLCSSIGTFRSISESMLASVQKLPGIAAVTKGAISVSDVAVHKAERSCTKSWSGQDYADSILSFGSSGVRRDVAQQGLQQALRRFMPSMPSPDGGNICTLSPGMPHASAISRVERSAMDGRTASVASMGGVSGLGEIAQQGLLHGSKNAGSCQPTCAQQVLHEMLDGIWQSKSSPGREGDGNSGDVLAGYLKTASTASISGSSGFGQITQQDLWQALVAPSQLAASAGRESDGNPGGALASDVNTASAASISGSSGVGQITQQDLWQTLVAPSQLASLPAQTASMAMSSGSNGIGEISHRGLCHALEGCAPMPAIGDASGGMATSANNIDVHELNHALVAAHFDNSMSTTFASGCARDSTPRSVGSSWGSRAQLSGVLESEKLTSSSTSGIRENCGEAGHRIEGTERSLQGGEIAPSCEAPRDLPTPIFNSIQRAAQ